MIDPLLVRKIVAGYSLPAMGIHGLPHWARVLETGLKLAERTGANPEIVALFAIFHDSRRLNEGGDRGHGARGAALARELRAEHLGLTNREFSLLETACVDHTKAGVEGEITVQTCWDADRLDLLRVGILPRNDRLCTAAAKDPELQRWACDRALAHFEPPIVAAQWLNGS